MLSTADQAWQALQPLAHLARAQGARLLSHDLQVPDRCLRVPRAPIVMPQPLLEQLLCLLCQVPLPHLGIPEKLHQFLVAFLFGILHVLHRRLCAL